MYTPADAAYMYAKIPPNWSDVPLSQARARRITRKTFTCESSHSTFPPHPALRCGLRRPPERPRRVAVGEAHIVFYVYVARQAAHGCAMIGGSAIIARRNVVGASAVAAGAGSGGRATELPPSARG